MNKYVLYNCPGHFCTCKLLGTAAAAPILFSFGLPVCNARPIYIYIYNMDLKKSLIIENLYNSNREV